MTILETQKEALTLLLRGMADSDQVFYAPLPKNFVTTNEEGVVSFTERFSFSVSAGAGTLVLTPSLDRETNIWHIDERYMVDANELWSGQSLMHFNTTVHQNNEFYAYVLLSASAPEYPEVGSVDYDKLLLSYPTRCVLAYASSVMVLLRRSV